MHHKISIKIALACLITLPACAISATYTVDSVAELKTRLSQAKDGDTIKIDGNGGNKGVYTYTGSTYSTYTTDGYTNIATMFMLDNVKDVTIEALNANKKPLLRGANYKDKYVFYAQKADGLTIRNIRFSHASKGVVVDRTNNLTFENNTISETGQEAFHLRDGSDYALIRSNHIHDTGLVKVARGEAIYICNDRKMWNSYYQPKELEENYQQNCDYAHITGNTLGPNIGNNSIDVKEGTVGVYINNNTIDLGWTRSELKNSDANDHPDVSIHLKGAEGVATNNTFNFKNAPKSLYRAISVDQQLDKDPALKEVHGYDNWAVNNTVKNAKNGQYVFFASSRGGATVGCNTGAPDSLPKAKSDRIYVKVSGSRCEPPKAPTNKSAKPDAKAAKSPKANAKPKASSKPKAANKPKAVNKPKTTSQPKAQKSTPKSKSSTSKANGAKASASASSKGGNASANTKAGKISNTGSKKQKSAAAQCINYAPSSKLTEITLNSAMCIKVKGGLKNKSINFADSDKHSSCDFRATAQSNKGNSSHVINSNWETTKANWTGDIIRFSKANNCKYLKLRVRA